jgi:DNA-directed RNA polymerase specialized sigma24 family protein
MAMKVQRGADPPRVEELGTRRLAAAPEDPLAVLHRDNYDGLVRLAAVVLGDVGLAEQVVQDAFVRIATR